MLVARAPVGAICALAEMAANDANAATITIAINRFFDRKLIWKEPFALTPLDVSEQMRDARNRIVLVLTPFREEFPGRAVLQHNHYR
jgi:hypothetical protein